MPNTVNSYIETDLGNVSPNPRGEYNSTYDYEYLDLVYYKGGSYLCLVPLGETIKNVPPIEGQTTTNWQCVAIPGDLTPEYKSMYNEVVKDYNETNTNTADVAQMKASTYASMTAAQESESKASTSETNARNSEVNAKQSMDKAKEYSDEAIRANNDTQSLVTGFDEHVTTAISNAEASISESTDNAKGEIVAQKSSSLNEFRTDAETVMTNEKNVAVTEIHQMIDDFSADADSKKQEVITVADEKINDMTALKNDAVNAKNAAETAATTAVEKASEATTSADEAKASSDEAKANADLVAADKAIVAADKTEIGGMKSAVESSVAKFESDLETYNLPTMNNDINELKSDLDNLGLLNLKEVRESYGCENVYKVNDLIFDYDGTTTWKYVREIISTDIPTGTTVTIIVKETHLSYVGNLRLMDIVDGVPKNYVKNLKVGVNTYTLKSVGLAIHMQVSTDTIIPEADIYYAKGITVYDADITSVKYPIPEELTGVDVVQEIANTADRNALNAKNATDDNFTIVKSENLLDPSKVQHNGYYLSLQGIKFSSDKFVQYELNDVKEGDTYVFSKLNSNGNASNLACRFCTVYNANGEAVESKGSENATSFVIQSDVVKVIFTINVSNGDPAERVWTIRKKTETSIKVIPYFDPYYEFNDKAVNRILEITHTNEPNRHIRSVGNISSGDSMVLEDNHIKSNKRISFSAKVDQLNELVIAHGLTSYGGSYIVIDTTSIRQYNYTTSETLYKSFSHNLNIVNDIEVLIEATVNQTAKIRVCSQGEWYECETNYWSGCNGKIEAISNGSTLTDCILSFTTDGYWQDIQLYGDSYFGASSRVRWLYYLVNDGYANKSLIDGYPGKGSIMGLKTFELNLTHSKPKYAVWCLGMNDPDSSTGVNSTWLSCVNQFLDMCHDNNITPILATIPTVTGGAVDDTSISNMRIHKYKNEYVRSSGRRYIDFDKAVGANETTGTWYDGMLSSDGVHPSEKGARALYMQVLVDFPEIMQK